MRASRSRCSRTRARAGGKHARETLADVGRTRRWPALLATRRRARSRSSRPSSVSRARSRARADRACGLAARRARADRVAAAPRSARRVSPARRRACAGWRCSRAGSAVRSTPRHPSATTRLDDRSVADFCRVYLGPARARASARAALRDTLRRRFAEATSRELLFTLLDGRAGSARSRRRRGARSSTRSPRARRGFASARAWRRSSRTVAAFGSRAASTIAADAVVLAVGAREAMRLLPDPLARGDRRRRAAARGVRARARARAARPPRASRTRGVRAGARGRRARGRVEARSRAATELRIAAAGRAAGSLRAPRPPSRRGARALPDRVARRASLPGLAGFIEARAAAAPAEAVPAFAVGHYRAVARFARRSARAARAKRRRSPATGWSRRTWKVRSRPACAPRRRRAHELSSARALSARASRPSRRFRPRAARRARSSRRPGSA